MNTPDTEKNGFQKFLEDNPHIAGKAGALPTTPDIEEWEKEFEEMWKILDYEVCMRVKTHGTQRLEDYVQAEPEDIKAFITSLITSVKQERDTYWKERVEEALETEYRKRNPPNQHNILDDFRRDVLRAITTTS